VNLAPDRPALFIDRDGTLIHEVDHCHRPDDVQLVPGAVEALATAKAAGYWLIIITNQSGIGRGLFTIDDFRAVESHIASLLGAAAPDATYFCPDHPAAATPRRKPGTGMIDEARAAHPIHLPGSWMIGDKAIDIQCGQNAGIRTALVQTGYGTTQRTRCNPDLHATNLPDAIRQILSL